MIFRLLLFVEMYRRLHAFAALGRLAAGEEAELLQLYGHLGVTHLSFSKHMLHRVIGPDTEGELQTPPTGSREKSASLPPLAYSFAGASRADAALLENTQRRVLVQFVVQRVVAKNASFFASRPALALQLLELQRHLVEFPPEWASLSRGLLESDEECKAEAATSEVRPETVEDFLSMASSFLAATPREELESVVAENFGFRGTREGRSSWLLHSVYTHPSYEAGIGFAADQRPCQLSLSPVLPFLSLEAFCKLPAAEPSEAAAAARPAAEVGESSLFEKVRILARRERSDAESFERRLGEETFTFAESGTGSSGTQAVVVDGLLLVRSTSSASTRDCCCRCCF